MTGAPYKAVLCSQGLGFPDPDASWGRGVGAGDTATAVQTGNGTLIVVARMTGPSWGYSQSSREALAGLGQSGSRLFLPGWGPATALSFPGEAPHMPGASVMATQVTEPGLHPPPAAKSLGGGWAQRELRAFSWG